LQKATNNLNESLDDVLRATNEARGLLNDSYTTDEYFRCDRDAVIGKTWAGIAFGSELPAPGFAKPVNFMGLPLLVIRNLQGEIKVFHNVCSHRGMLLMEDEKPVRTVIRCRYHSWSYDLDGALKATPHIGGVDVHDCEGFSRDNHGLKSIASAVWMDIVFVNLCGTAEPFADFIEPLATRWEALTGDNGLDQVASAESGSHMELPVEANWKLPVENFCEAYHLPWVHPELNRISPLTQHYNIVGGENVSGQGSYNYTPTPVAEETLPKFTEWPEDKITHAEYLALYPNVLLGIQADHTFAILLLPREAGKTVEKLQINYVGMGATEDRFKSCRDATLANWKEVFVEDVFAVEALQDGRQSPGFDGGVFTPLMDAPTHNFHKWVARGYLAEHS